MRIIILFICACLIYGCSPISNKSLTKSLKETDKKFHDHTGFVLYDPEKDKTIVAYNSDKYFTPASNTKIFTFYTALRILGDSVPAFHYVENNDSLIIWGTGDPSFLYKNVHNNNRVYDFLSAVNKPIYFSSSNYFTSHFGPGWAWDDYSDYYSPERSPLPVFGNIFTVKLFSPIPEIIPTSFRKYYSVGEQKEKYQLKREHHSNNFKIYPGKTRSRNLEWDVPMKLDRGMITQLLADTLNKPVTEISKPLPALSQIYYSGKVDSLYRVLMQDSDNFIAEQLLLMCADVLSDSLQPEIAIRYAKENILKDLPDEPIWVDGSGLSRYNLFTPRSIVKLWQKIYTHVPQDRLFPLLATGGKYGTIKNWYKADKPFIFGKTGSLNNVHNLSGYLVTKSGKTLIFAFMNNNFTTTTSDVRRNMQEILFKIYEKY